MFDKKAYMKEWRKDNKEHRKEYQIKWESEHKEYKKKWDSDNRERCRKYTKTYQKKKNRTDLKFNITQKVRCSIWYSIRYNKNGRKWESLVGYTLKDLIKHLKSTIPKGYTWQDYIDGKLQIDHKIPISIWDYTNPENINFKRCWALDNLRLLPKEENLTKRNKLIKPFQPALAI